MGISHSARRAQGTCPTSAAETVTAREHLELTLDEWHGGEPIGSPVSESDDDPCIPDDDRDGVNEEADDDEHDDEDGETSEEDESEDEEDDEGKWDACAVCCEMFQNITLSGSEDLMDTSEPGLVRICQDCGMKICGKCVTKMFLAAIKDPTQMPPKCCKIFSIHLARPYLTDAQTSAYRDKFDEWVSCKKVYCPVATCSAFIADRLRPIDPRVQPNYACPRNESHILCSNCHSFDHPGISCNAATASSASMEEMLNLIDGWGYKQCPRCGTAIKRMYGCAHMQCYCGAHFCWACLNPIGQCEQGETCRFTEDYCETDDDCSRPDDNLDSRRAQNWTWGFDFGQDPGLTEVSDAGAWCCDHHLIKLHQFETCVDGKKYRGDTLLECSRCWTFLHIPPSSPHNEQPSPCSTNNSMFLGTGHRPCSIMASNEPKNFGKAKMLTDSPLPPTELDRHSLRHAWMCVECGLLYCRGCILESKALKTHMCLIYDTNGEEKEDVKREVKKGTKKRPRADTDPSAPALKKQH